MSRLLLVASYVVCIFNGVNVFVNAENVYGKGCKYTVEMIRSANTLGDTSLHFSSRYGFVNLTEYLIEKGANVNALNSENNAPIHLAVWYHNSNTVDALIVGGASLNIFNSEGNSPLILSVMNSNYHIASTLLANGALTDLARKDGATALDIALAKKDMKMIELLREGSTGKSLTMKGDTLLHVPIAVHGKEIGNADIKMVNMKGIDSSSFGRYNKQS